MSLIRKILVAVDFSDYSLPQLRYAAALAEEIRADLVVMHVVDEREISAIRHLEPEMGSEWAQNFETNMIRDREKNISDLLQEAQCSHVPSVQIVKTGHPAKEIVRAIQETGADLLVVGTKGRTNLADAILGSVAERLYRRSPVTVLSVRGKEHADLVCRLPGDF